MEELPAILGGKPIRPEGPPIWPISDSAIRSAFATASESTSWGVYNGPMLRQLSQEIKEYFQIPFVIFCASGTLAIETVLKSCGVNHESEVILAGYEYEPSLLSILNLGAKPVLLDVYENCPVLDTSHLESAITEKTKAILVSHLHGGIAAMPELNLIAARHKIPVIEDAAQAMGGSLENKKLGTWGDYGILSFGGSKLMSSGRGGAIFCKDQRLFQRLNLLLSRGIQQLAPLSELQAIVLIPQLQQLGIRHQQRARSVQRLCQKIVNFPGFRTIDYSHVLSKDTFVERNISLSTDQNYPIDNRAVPSFQNQETINQTIDPGYYKCGFYFDDKTFGLSRSLFIRALRAEGFAFDSGFRSLFSGRSPKRYLAPFPMPQAIQTESKMIILHHPILLETSAFEDEILHAIKKIYALREEIAKRANSSEEPEDNFK